MPLNCGRVVVAPDFGLVIGLLRFEFNMISGDEGSTEELCYCAAPRFDGGLGIVRL